jgi:fructuronate reductase
VSFVATSVDRITPRTTESDLRAVAAECGWIDRAPVVTEPFSDWVLSGRFPLGRPQWESAGARFVDDIEPYEKRKLWLLNGAHSLLAYAGMARGHETVSAALADPVCLRMVEDFWDEAARHLPAELETDGYRAALLDRFGNARISHRLEQISADGSTKLRMRVLPIFLAERAAGRSGAGSAAVLAAWLGFVRTAGRPGDTALEGSPDFASLSGARREQRALEVLSPELADSAFLGDLIDLSPGR